VSAVSALPTSLMLEPTRRCNLRCPLCITGRGEVVKAPDFTTDRFRMLFDQLTDGCQSIIFHNYGEPLLNRDLPAMIAHAKAGGCAATSLSTNATLLDDWWCEALATCGLDEIVVAVDGLTQETYVRYRVGGKLRQVEAGIRRLVDRIRARGAALQVVMQFIVFKHNEHEVDQVPAYGAGLGVHKVSIKISGSATRSPEFRPSNGAYVAKNRSGHRQGPLCDWVFRTLVVNTDGEVMPCCWAGHKTEYSMGNVFRQSVAEIWNSERYQTLRQAVSTRTGLWPLCEAKCLHGEQSLHITRPVVPATATA
jgi:radical SAM protein with 4Fe4S-binding SPASM domain